jgi:hypothetical protein
MASLVVLTDGLCAREFIQLGLPQTLVLVLDLMLVLVLLLLQLPAAVQLSIMLALLASR